MNKARAPTGPKIIRRVLMTADPVFNDHRATVIAAAGLLIFGRSIKWREFPDANGLVSSVQT
jgi:hypothetical protein